MHGENSTYTVQRTDPEFAHMFDIFNVLFKTIPLCTVVGNSVLVLHGGLCHDTDLQLDTIDDIDRAKYNPTCEPPYPENTVGMDEKEKRAAYLEQICRELLWSDPKESPGVEPSKRGCGVFFGPDVARKFMANNRLSMIIRSHECCQTGLDFPYADTKNPPNLCTLFSCSNYGKSNNSAAYIIILPHSFKSSKKIGNTSLHFASHHFKTSETDMETVKLNSKKTLLNLMIKKKKALVIEFEDADQDGDDMVGKSEWAAIMEKVCKIHIRWLLMIDLMVPRHCIKGDRINYKHFIDSFPSVNGKDPKASNMMDAMYACRDQLDNVFRYFDTNKDGIITRDEFRAGCAALNASMGEGVHYITL